MLITKNVTDFEHEVKCLRKWLREMESRLQPLSFHVDWTLAELEEKAVEHMVSTKTAIACKLYPCSACECLEFHLNIDKNASRIPTELCW